MIVETTASRNEDMCVFDVTYGKDRYGDYAEPSACGYLKWAHANKADHDHAFTGHTVERDTVIGVTAERIDLLKRMREMLPGCDHDCKSGCEHDIDDNLASQMITEAEGCK
jgi:hypothetical protein